MFFNLFSRSNGDNVETTRNFVETKFNNYFYGSKRGMAVCHSSFNFNDIDFCYLFDQVNSQLTHYKN